MIKEKLFTEKTFQDPETGKLESFTLMRKNVLGDAMDKTGWRRVILLDVIKILTNLTGDRKMMVVEFLIENMNINNEIDLTQDEVVQATRISKKTVNDTFKALVSNGFIKKIKRKYVLNTQIVSVLGATEKNKKLCIEYDFMPYEFYNKSNDNKFSNEKRLAKLQAKKREIEQEEKRLISEVKKSR
ncbi:replication/maintenance protein RepL [Malaciobacter marinus]|jgi:hypothetical protein|uniref:replication/maintenance protein RepL n=1 Tax=Malaciobacter marinus TaxID=505249 RepID=UPI0009A6185C|nr:replication/maintenance protein RepL [Malaciobacter marinus]SKB57053.1 replication protein (RepL) [Malaciobacter marinus]